MPSDKYAATSCQVPCALEEGTKRFCRSRDTTQLHRHTQTNVATDKTRNLKMPRRLEMNDF